MKKTLKFENATVTISQDDNAQNPRVDMDNLGKCIFFHKRYSFGDDHNINADDYNSFAEMEKDLIKNHNAVVVLPVYMYDHSGQTVRTTPFGDRWDSGQLGFIIATRDNVKKEYSVKQRISAKVKATVTKVLEGEIETLDTYLKGEIYGFESVDAEGNEDSCWGFYGDDKDNGIFDHLDLDGVTQEMYNDAFELAEWEY